MNDYIPVQKVLEGLIHNLNNPLNLILAYSHRLKKDHPELTELDKIYDAGIKIDDLLKELYQLLIDKALAQKTEICLNDWLSGELEYLQHYLPIKHTISFVRQDNLQNLHKEVNPLELALWFETALLCLMAENDSMEIRTGVSEYEDSYAVYLIPNRVLPDSIAHTLILKAKSHIVESEGSIKSVCNKERNTLWGVLI
ncbi:MAG: hypothetical protein PHY41_00365 [Candidatus Cloacimonetes bacterium]|jgi:hypothetical protein|nr:hypothetical protein [Candidatus Cloacimonadota bacterium]MDY0299061.1 hypothetical protein [Candidatus Cloacimonadaceae bacterium]MCB5279311.1 hypothetical protein [Candidatus Cloacimonadota bacterium]MCK9331565.1 hypothetical protein [Candidatus Cloacimonadota bacterium]MDD2211234.1 hypothetical protein [Candidatus Cloacimonadota bacterium]